MLEYLLDREVQAVVSMIEAVKRGEDKEKIIELLRILQGDLMTLRTMCAWLRGRYRCTHCGNECFEKIVGEERK